MIKSVLTVCVAAVISAPAFAQSPAAVQALRETEAGKQFIQQVLKMKSGATSAEILAKINALPAKETAAIAAAITTFGSAVRPVAGNLKQQADAKKKNADLAASIFAKNGQAVQLAALTAKYGSTVSVDSAVAAKAAQSAGQCSSVLDASKMAEGTKVSFATADAVIKAGYIKRGKCEENPEAINVVSKENLVETGACAMNQNALSKQGKARLAIYGSCLIEAQANDNSPTALKDQKAAEKAIGSVGDNCEWVPVSAKAAAL